MESDRRKQKRRKFTYYVQVMDASSLQLIGHLADISLIGIRVDCEKPLKVNGNYKLRVDLSPELANKTYMIFDGRCKWCEMDRLEPNSYNVGFEVYVPGRDDQEIFERMYDKYGREMVQ